MEAFLHAISTCSSLSLVSVAILLLVNQLFNRSLGNLASLLLLLFLILLITFLATLFVFLVFTASLVIVLINILVIRIIHLHLLLGFIWRANDQIRSCLSSFKIFET